MERTPVWIRITDLPTIWVEKLKCNVDRAEFWHGTEEEADPNWLATVKVIFTDQSLPHPLVRRLSHLKWVQFTRGGAYDLMEPALRESNVAVSVIPGISGVQLSELAMGCIILWAKHFPHFFRAQQEKRWDRPVPLEVAGMTLGILGLGAIGSATARKGKAFDMRVLGIKRTLIPKPDFVDELWTPDHLGDLLSQSDFFVISIPTAQETFGLIGLEELRQMKRTAYLINLTGRYAIKEEHLVQALREGWIAGAALDTYPRNPLPPDSALWELPNVFITPRIGSSTPKWWERRIPVFEENLKKFLAGQKFPTVNKTLGM